MILNLVYHSHYISKKSKYYIELELFKNYHYFCEIYALYMSKDILLQGKVYDILIRDGIVFGVGRNFSLKPDTIVIQTQNLYICPGFVDLHVHFREPGFSYKETIKTGSMAAARGGYTTVCAMPNLDPVPDSLDNLKIEQELIDRDAVIEVLPYASITKGRKGKEVVDFKTLKDYCCAFSDDGSGVQDTKIMFDSMIEAASYGSIIAAHCEDNSLLNGGYINKGRYALEHGHRGICSESEWGQISRDIELAAKTGVHYHICHISCKESVDLVKEAKSRGINVSCETAPHYLSLCEDNLQEEGRFKMNPPLRTAEDKSALIQGIADGTIDAIATDHAPHSFEEKSKGLKDSAMGITGLETAFSVLYTDLVRTEKLSLERIIECLTDGPRRVFGLKPISLSEGSIADITIIDLNQSYIINSEDFRSKGHSTPFEGKEVWGKVLMTIKNGKIVYAENSFYNKEQ